MKQWFLSIALIAVCIVSARATDDTGRGYSFTFATVNQSREVLTRRDDFVLRLSPFDRAARMKTNKEISEDSYVRFVGENVRAWPDDERAAVESALSSIKAVLEVSSLPWPQTIYLIRTTGNEEGGAAYTRDNAIVLPATELIPEKRGALKKVLAHELFHILTRRNPGLKEKFYAAIGFKNCGEIKFPSKLKAIKITNPDAPKNDHCIHLQVAGKPVWAVPILFSRTSTYDMNEGGEFFNYLQFKFVLVDGDNAAPPRNAVYDDSKVQLVDPDRVSGFFEQVGRNTDYIIHPEEILADNFALLILGDRNAPSPSVLEKMTEIIAGVRTGKVVGSTERAKMGSK